MVLNGCRWLQPSATMGGLRQILSMCLITKLCCRRDLLPLIVTITTIDSNAYQILLHEVPSYVNGSLLYPRWRHCSLNHYFRDCKDACYYDKNTFLCMFDNLPQNDFVTILPCFCLTCYLKCHKNWYSIIKDDLITCSKYKIQTCNKIMIVFVTKSIKMWQNYHSLLQ